MTRRIDLRFAVGVIVAGTFFEGAATCATTIVSQDFGATPIGTPVVVNVSIPSVNAGPPVIALRYSTDYSIGSCASNGCSVPVTFNPSQPGLRQDAVVVKDANGQLVEEILLHGVGQGALPVFSPAIATYTAAVSGLMTFSQVVAEPNGKILLLETASITEYDPSTNNFTNVVTLPSQTPPSGYGGLGVDAAGNLFYDAYTNTSTALHRVDRLTGADSVFANNVYEVKLIGPDGKIYCIDGDQVLSVDPNTAAATVVAGNGTHGFAGDGGPATQAEFAYPAGLALDLAGNIYVADSANQRIRKIDTSGNISTIAGTGTNGYTGDGGPAISAELNFPEDLVVDPAGDVYVTVGLTNGQLRRIDAGTGIISTVAGATPQTSGSSTSFNPFLGLGYSASAQDLGVSGSIALDSSGNIWVAEGIYPAGAGLFKISASANPIQFPFMQLGQAATQTVSLLNAGTANLTQPVLGVTGSGSSDFSSSSNCPAELGNGTECTISVTYTAGAYLDSHAVLSLTDNGTSSPQAIAVSGTSGGAVPATQQLGSVAVGVSSASPQSVSVRFSTTASSVSAVLAYGTEFSLGQLNCSGTGTMSCTVPVTFSPLYPGNRQDAIQFLDSSGSVIYQCFVSGVGVGAQVLPDPAVTSTMPSAPQEVTLSALDNSGNLYAVPYVSGGSAGEVYKFNPVTSQWSVVAGQATGGVDTGDGGPATSATLSYVNAVAFDPAGNMFIAETFHIRRVDAKTGVITTIAQQGGTAITLDSAGYIYVISVARQIFKIDPTTGVATLYAGNGQYGDAGDGGPATSASLEEPSAIALDSNGNLLIEDYPHFRIVNPNTGIINTYVTRNCGASGSIALDAAGDLYLACGAVQFVPAGGGMPQFIAQGLVNIGPTLLRTATGIFYTGNQVLTPALVSPLTFNTAIAGSSVNTSIKLSNVGNAALSLNSLSFTGGQSIFGQTNTCGTNVAPGQACSVTLSATPPIAGTFTSSLSISTSAGSLQTTLSVTSISDLLQASQNSVNFGTLNIGGGYPVLILISNNTGIIVEVTNVGVSGPDASDFSAENGCPSTITYTCPMYAHFTAGAIGNRTATMSITYTARGVTETLSIPLTATSAAGSVSGALQFVPVTPCRVADTRNAAGPFGGPEMAGGATREFVVTSSPCNIPANAAAFALNVTVVPDAALGYLTVWPSGQTQPVVSTLNSLDGRTKANAAIVPAGSDGGIDVFASNPTHVVIDINGYFMPASNSTLQFYPVSPCRIADSRNANGALGGPYLSGGNARDFPVLASSCGIPASASAYSMNFTAVPRGPLGYISIWPTGQTQPLVSTLNALTGAVTANAAIVPAGSNGDISIFASNDSDLVIDINGYFAPPGNGGLSLYTIAPGRVLDTRSLSGPLNGTYVAQIVSGSGNGSISSAQAFVLNTTVVPTDALGYLTLWPDGATQPYVSTLNSLDGSVTSNMSIVPTTNGALDAFASNQTQLILDISGFFAP